MSFPNVDFSSEQNYRELRKFTERQVRPRRSAESAGPLRVDRVAFPGTDIAYEIQRPSDIDCLLDAAAGDPEQNLPYWAELWPSGIALAAAISLDRDIVHGKSVLEIGCGLGVTAIAALRAGADLLVTDYSSEAISLCLLNSLSQSGREPRTLQVNWRNPSTAFASEVGSGFPVVLAADVLYEARDIEPLLALVDDIVAANGVFYLAEPGRRPAAQFLESMRDRGWRFSTRRFAGPWPDPDDNRKGVVVGVHRLTKAMDAEMASISRGH